MLRTILFCSTLLILPPATGCVSSLFAPSNSNADEELSEVVTIKEKLNRPGSFRNAFTTDKATGLDPKSREIEHNLGYK